VDQLFAAKRAPDRTEMGYPRQLGDVGQERVIHLARPQEVQILHVVRTQGLEAVGALLPGQALASSTQTCAFAVRSGDIYCSQGALGSLTFGSATFESSGCPTERETVAWGSRTAAIRWSETLACDPVDAIARSYPSIRMPLSLPAGPANAADVAGARLDEDDFVTC
jgi:hypothetical protein